MHARMHTIVSRALAECRFVELRGGCSSLDDTNKVAEQAKCLVLPGAPRRGPGGPSSSIMAGDRIDFFQSFIKLSIHTLLKNCTTAA